MFEPEKKRWGSGKERSIYSRHWLMREVIILTSLVDDFQGSEGLGRTGKD